MEFAPTVYIVNADPIANSLTKQLLASINIFCRDFESPADFLDTTNFSSPCCFLFSFLLPEMSGMDLMLKLRKEKIIHPCIFTSSKNEPDLVVKAMQTGAYSFIKKPFEPMTFVELIQKALDFDKQTNKYIAIGLRYEKNIMMLTDREKAVLELILEDFSAMKIGEKLAISHRTIENHRNKIFSKMRVSNLFELIRVATIHETLCHTNLIHS